MIFAAAIGFFAAGPASADQGSATAAAEPRLGRSTGLPLPRFASVKADAARLRKGPGIDYPILFELTRRGLPVKIIGEYGHWRRVALHDGSRGWMHRILLSGRRTAILIGPDRALREEPQPNAAATAQIGPVTPLRLAECRVSWCEAEGKGVRGWAAKDRLWGAAAQEIFD